MLGFREGAAYHSPETSQTHLINNLRIISNSLDAIRISAIVYGCYQISKQTRRNEMADLYADGNRGIYIPQHFAESVHREYVTGVSDEDWKTLEEGPDAEWYWDAWNNVLSNAKITAPDGREGYLWQDGDLWVIWGESDPDYENLVEEI
jgi:hypothetical protein